MSENHLIETDGNGAVQVPAVPENLVYAPLWRRLTAFVLNTVFNVLVFAPSLLGIAEIRDKYSAYLLENHQSSDWVRGPDGGSVLLLVVFAYIVAQLYSMGWDGQSLGKRIMGIVVVKSDGSPADFWDVVMMREFFWPLKALIMITAAGMVFGEGGQGLAGFLFVWLNAKRMIFTEGGRTMPDEFADTVVVRKVRAE